MALAETARMLAQADYKDNITPGVNRSIKSVDKLESRFKRLGSQASKGIKNAAANIERFAVIGVGAAAGALTYSVKAAIDWESAVAGINKTIEATPDELAAITQGIRDMSKVMPVAATDLAAIAEQAGALGIAKADILAFTETVAMIGTTTDVSTDMAATALGQLGNVLKLTGADYDNFASTLVDLGNKGASTESQILEITRRSGAAANLIGLAKDATLGWASAAANLGINQELAGTSLQSFYLKALPLFTQGSKELQEITGQTAKQLKTSFKKDASGALEDFLKDLGKMPQDARLKAVQKLFGKGSGLTRLILGLSDSVNKNLTPSLDTASEAWETNTAAAAEAEKRYATTESQLTLLGNNVRDAAVTIGSNLLPLINELGKELVTWITAHQADIKRFGQDLANGIRDAVKWARSLDWDSIGTALKTAAGFAKGLLDVFLAMPTEVKTFIIALAGLNKLTGGAVSGIVSELAKGVIKGVLGITAGIVNINAAKVMGGGGIPAPAAGAAGSGAVAGAVVGGLSAAIIAGPIVQQLTVNDANQELAAAGIKSELKAMQGIWDFPALFANLGVAVDGLGGLLDGSVEEAQRSQAKADAETHSILNTHGSGTRTALGLINTQQRGTRTALGLIKPAITQSASTTRSAINNGAQSTARNLDQVTAAVNRKKLSVNVDVSQRQQQAIRAAISANTGSGPAGKRGFHYTRSQSHELDIDRVLAGGAVGITGGPMTALIGEAGKELYAVLKNPHKGTVGGGAAPVVHVTVNIDPRRITRKQTSSGVYKTYVAT